MFRYIQGNRVGVILLETKFLGANKKIVKKKKHDNLMFNELKENFKDKSQVL